MLFSLIHKISKSYGNLSLQNIITLPFLLQIFITVSLVGYFSWRNGERAVNNVTSSLRNEVTAGVKQHLADYLKTPHLIVRLKQNNIQAQQLNVDNFSRIRQDLWLTIQLFDTVRAIYIADETGKFKYIKQEKGSLYSKEVTEPPKRETHILDRFGKKQELIAVDRYDPTLRPWYLNTLKTQANNWSKIYTFTGGELGITAAGLLQDSQGKTQGIVGVDLVLSGMDRFLQNIEISKNGRVFILEPNGYLVATSAPEKPFTYDPNTKQEKRLRAIDSNSILVNKTTAYITQHFGNLHNIAAATQLEYRLEDENQLVQVVPYKDDLGLDWLIVVVMPESDFMTQIKANNLNTIWLCAIALAIATIIGIYTSRGIAQPIANLSQLTSNIAQNAKAKKTSTELYPAIKTRNIKELRSLADSFNEMVIQLKAAFRELENSHANLENRVRQRTEALMLAKEEADTANQAKSQFLANMSHELRTPLHAILGFTQVALQDPSLKPQQQENLLTVKRSGEHLLTLINDVLEMSKIEAGSLTIISKPFDLHLLLDNLAKMFGLKASGKNIQLTFNIPPNLPQYIETDPVKLNQILINLIENAIKFTDAGKVSLNLKLFTAGQETSLAFAVLDTGRGILPSQLESIFIPFSQTKQNDSQGTGLGLSISQQFARLLGGEISVTSEIGEGSLFKFKIPIKIVTKPDNMTIEQPTQSYITRQRILENAPIQVQAAVSKDAIAENSDFSASDLTQMPIAWIEELHQAAIAVDSDLILQAIAQIPSTENNLSQKLSKMLAEFEYDEIVNLTEGELERRGV
ncbi:MAG: ATP-binding protein [Cyanobacteria bacterium P01_G01_bin.19]